eukprot:3470161-Rhodomonas_salina.2
MQTLPDHKLRPGCAHFSPVPYDLPLANRLGVTQQALCSTPQAGICWKLGQSLASRSIMHSVAGFDCQCLHCTDSGSRDCGLYWERNVS